MSDLRMQYFGDKWDAPITDDADEIPTPTQMTCMHCGENFVDGDQGTINLSGWAEHKECGLRSVWGGIGHQVDHGRYCSGLGPDAGLSKRISAILVWAQFQGRAQFEVEDIESLRRAIEKDQPA